MFWKYLSQIVIIWKWILTHSFLSVFISQSLIKWSWKKISFHVVPGRVQEVLPVRSQDLIPVPENVWDLVGWNQDPAPGPTGVLLPHEKDLTQVHHHLLRGTEREVVLDLLHLVIGKKRRTRSRSPESQVIGENTKQPWAQGQPLGTPLLYPGTTGHLLDHPILVPVQVQKRNNVLKFTSKKKKKAKTSLCRQRSL